MTLRHVGRLAINVLVPLFFEAGATMEAGIAGPLATLQGQLAGLLALVANLTITPPGASVSLDLVAKLTAAVKAALALGLTPPSLAANISAAGLLIADLKLTIGALQAALDIALKLKGLSASVDVYAYEGPGAGLAVAIAGADLSALPGNAKAILIVADVDEPGVSSAMGLAFAAA